MPAEHKEHKEALAKRVDEKAMEVDGVVHVERLGGDYDSAVDVMDIEPHQAIQLFHKVIASEDNSTQMIKAKEQSIYHLGQLYAKLGLPEQVRKLMVEIRPFFSSIAKAKTAKIVRTLIDLVSELPNMDAFTAELCRESIAWCKKEKRTFLKQRIEARLAQLLLSMKQYQDALKLISRLIREVKKIDDKLLMVEIYIIESRIHLSLQNVPKAKGALTSARSASNSTYCPPLLQAEIDLQGGILCGEEKDFKTGFSYFYEAFESYDVEGKHKDKAILCLKYMLLCKIMLNLSSDVYSIINGKAGVKYVGIEVEAMKAIADAHKERSLKSFEDAQKKYKAQLEDDPIIFRHLMELYENLLQQNLIRIIEPFSRVQISHVAKLINLPVLQVEAKLSEMILDKRFNGILDQGSGDLIVFEETPADDTFELSLATVKELSHVVDKLYGNARKQTQ